MIYARWLGLAAVGSALSMSEAAVRDRVQRPHDEGAALDNDRSLSETDQSKNDADADADSHNVPAKTCLTEAQCDAARKKMGIKHLYVNAYHHHGCFRKNDKAFWGTGGTAAQMGTTDLSGIQERIWCDDDEWGDDGHELGDGWKGDGNDGWQGDGTGKPSE